MKWGNHATSVHMGKKNAPFSFFSLFIKRAMLPCEHLSVVTSLWVEKPSNVNPSSEIRRWIRHTKKELIPRASIRSSALKSMLFRQSIVFFCIEMKLYRNNSSREFEGSSERKHNKKKSYITYTHTQAQVKRNALRKRERESTEKSVCDSELITGHVNVILIFDCNNWDLSVNV